MVRMRTVFLQPSVSHRAPDAEHAAHLLCWFLMSNLGALITDQHYPLLCAAFPRAETHKQCAQNSFLNIFLSLLKSLSKLTDRLIEADRWIERLKTYHKGEI